jgi:uncharacterized repeat protein (TIGR02543 family)
MPARDATCDVTFTPIQYQLTVTVTGNGSVSEYTPSPQINNCTVASGGTGCVGTYDSGTTVILYATAGAGYDFTGWSGAGCNSIGNGIGSSPPNVAAVVMDADHTCTATFALQTTSYTLTVTAASGGSVSDGQPPNQINLCTATNGICTGTYLANTLVILTATPDTGYVFAGWIGDCTDLINTTPPQATVTMNANHACTAAFVSPGSQYVLSVTVDPPGSGSGSVDDNQSPNSIFNCGNLTGGSSCTGAYAAGTVVILTATAAPGATFTGWSGDCASTGTLSTATVTMAASYTCTATFTPPPPPTLTVIVAGNGSVNETNSYPLGTPKIINCTAAGVTGCSGTYATGTIVFLTATLAAATDTVTWSGAGCSPFGPVGAFVVMDTGHSCTATFTPSTTQHTLTLTMTGNGSVNDGPLSRITNTSCTAAAGGTTNCTGTYATGTLVTLTATATAGNVFAGWVGDCTDLNPAPPALPTAQVTMDADHSCTAKFVPAAGPSYALNVQVTGNGSVGDNQSPTSIFNCGNLTGGSSCTGDYAAGTAVILTATPGPGATFGGWGGDCASAGTSSTATITMNAIHNCTATFASTSTLAVSVTGGGSVSDDQTPKQISLCTTAGGANCTGTYSTGTLVTLTATATTGNVFAGWGGDCTDLNPVPPAAPSAQVTMNANYACTARFVPNQGPPYVLNVRVAGSGNVRDNQSPTLIFNCGAPINGSSCTGAYAAGTVVILTATAAPGATFTGWSGDCANAGTSPTATVTTNAIHNCTATFTSTPTLTITVLNNGGNINETATNPSSATAAQISSCSSSGGSCKGFYATGTVVTLTATPAPGYILSGWGGSCTGTATVVTVTMDASRNCLVSFAPASPPPPPPPSRALTSQEITGDWYDPAYNGSGFNIIQTTQGLLLFYYGWDNAGHRLWLISDIGPKQVNSGTPLVLNMNQTNTNTGRFLTPAAPSTLTVWGKLTITFGAGNNTASATLSGKDGTVGLSLMRLDGMTNTASVTGDWYQPSYNGSGFDILMAPQGLILYYYGWDNDGNRLWLVSDITAADTVPGASITLNMKTTNNTTKDASFINPAKPSTLSLWGTLKINFSSCSKATGTLASQDGSSTVTYDNLQMIVGVLGASPGC